MSVKNEIRILQIESNSEDARAMDSMLSHDMISQFSLERAIDELEVSLLIKDEQFDVVLIGVSRFDHENTSDISSLISLVQRAEPNLPVILTGIQVDDQIKTFAAQRGIHDIIPTDIFDAVQVRSTIRFVVQKKRVLQLIPTPTKDKVTGLPTKSVLQDRMEQVLTHAEREHEQVALCYLQIDQYEQYAKDYGAIVSNAMLIKASELIQSCVDEHVVVCHLEKGRFALLFAEASSLAATTSKLEKIVGVMSRRRTFETQRLRMSVSVGLAFYPSCGNQKSLHQCAEEALFRASQAGGNRYKVYTDNLSKEAIWKYRLDRDLQRALLNNEFCLHYQPVIDLESGRPKRLEALLRWQHPEAGLIYPNAFIEHLETLEMIRDVGEWILRLATRQLKSWRAMGLDLSIDVNISREQLTDPTFCERVVNALEESGLEARYLELELTERQHIPEHDKVSHGNIHALVGMGVSFAIDDYGVGHNSDEYLRRFPHGTFSTLKLDRSYIENITENPTDAACVRRDTDFAHDLGLKVIAEGIETPEQLALIKALGADAMQGFLVSKPLAAPRLADCLWRNEFDLDNIENRLTHVVG